MILADDSAHWRIAGLRQLERLAREINELGVACGETIIISIRWSPNLPPSARFPPKPGRLSHIEFEATPPQSADLLLSSRIFLYRHSSSRLVAAAKPFAQLSQDFAQLIAEVRAAWQNSDATEGWEYLEAFRPNRRVRKTVSARDGKIAGRFGVAFHQSSDLPRDQSPPAAHSDHAKRLDAVDLSPAFGRRSVFGPWRLRQRNCGAALLPALQHSGRLRRRNRSRQVPSNRRTVASSIPGAT